jgi:hypothetical protein
MAADAPDINDLAGVLDLAARTLARKAEIQKAIKALKIEEEAIDRMLRATWAGRINDMRGMMIALIEDIRLPEDERKNPVTPYDPDEDPDRIVDEPEDREPELNPEDPASDIPPEPDLG